MKNIISILMATVISGCAGLPPEYSGPDAGYAVIGIGATSETNYSSYGFYTRKEGEKESEYGSKPATFFYFQNNSVYSRGADYKSDSENGVIEGVALAPGNYEIYNFGAIQSVGISGHKFFSSREKFSIPFTIKPGRITYLGNYQANGLRGENIFGMSMSAGVYFVVSDRKDIDIALLKKRRPVITTNEVDNATPEVESIKNPFFRAKK